LSNKLVEVDSDPGFPVANVSGWPSASAPEDKIMAKGFNAQTTLELLEALRASRCDLLGKRNTRQ
jgi:hypothetical protein